jgi:CRISPR-associated protein Csb2
VLAITLRFPLGVYHAQSQADFARAEWPPHPVRLIAALVAAAHGGEDDGLEAARAVIDRIAHAGSPLIRAPRQRDPRAAAEEDELQVTDLRGASRWAPRNHELGELKSGISPRDPGRGRAEVHKVGVAIGDLPVAFVWPDLALDGVELATLTRVAEDVTVVGTSRSPVLVEVQTGELPPEVHPERATWRPAAERTAGVTAVRVPDPGTLTQLDTWHARRSAPLGRDGTPAKAPLVVAPRIGSVVSYVHDRDPVPVVPFDPAHWGDMLILRVGDDVVPKAPASFAFARAMRKALLDTYADAGEEGEAPSVLRARDRDPHAAFVSLSFVADVDDHRPGAKHANGRVLGIAIILPHEARCRGVAEQRLAVVSGLMRLIDAGTAIRVPGVGPVAVMPLPAADQRYTLQEGRYRAVSNHWTTVTPIVHSRYRQRKSLDALFDQVAAECRDVGLPAPSRVQVRRGPRLRGAPARIGHDELPASWTGPLKGPQAHLDVWFDEPVHGPILLGRARHFGLGLCLPVNDATTAA